MLLGGWLTIERHVKNIQTGVSFKCSLSLSSILRNEMHLLVKFRRVLMLRRNYRQYLFMQSAIVDVAIRRNLHLYIYTFFCWWIYVSIQVNIDWLICLEIRCSASERINVTSKWSLYSSIIESIAPLRCTFE